MICPKCKSEKFTKSEMTPSRTKVYYTLNYDKFILRYRICLVCGYKWKTIEAYHDDVRPRKTTA